MESLTVARHLQQSAAHPSCLVKVSQTNTRWLLCSWMGRPGSVARGQRRVGGGREVAKEGGAWCGSVPRHPPPTLSTPARPRGLPVCALLHSQRSSLSPGWERLSPPNPHPPSASTNTHELALLTIRPSIQPPCGLEEPEFFHVT